tara:strand:+ start:507 stop:1286 length:780 start_codon:yes stop_codon:yes gene_type:complete
MKLKDILQGKVYTDKDRPPFQVKEALTKKAYPELKGQNKYLLNSVKNLMRAIKNQNDLTTREEIEYIHTKSKLMMSMLDDKRYNESVDEQQKIDSNNLMIEFGNAFQKFTRAVHFLGKSMTNITGDKTDQKIIQKAFKKHVIPFGRLIDSWNKGQQKNPHINEDFWAKPAPFSSQEAKSHLDMDIKKMSKHLGKASQQAIKIMMDGVKGGRYDALDIQRGLEHGPAERTNEGEKTFLKLLWRKVREGFRRYSKNNKLRK